jgi:hypothetical protein
MVTISVVLCLFSILGSVVATWFYLAQLNYEQSPLALEFLARQARPMKRSRLILSVISGVCLVPGFVFLAMDGSRTMTVGMNLSTLAVGVMLSCQFIQHHFQRLRAMEEIVRRSRPDLYSEIRSK